VLTPPAGGVPRRNGPLLGYYQNTNLLTCRNRDLGEVLTISFRSKYCLLTVNLQPVAATQGHDLDIEPTCESTGVPSSHFGVQ
jgi:hypothetical protein